jgi:transglutaminase-like putative cysteine protease
MGPGRCHPCGMALTELPFGRAGRRVEVSSRIPLLSGDPAQIALRIAVARDPSVEIEVEALLFDGTPLSGSHERDGSSIAWAHTDGTPTIIGYEATVLLRERSPRCVLAPGEVLHWTSPSRYCPSDLMMGFARSVFGKVEGAEAIDQVTAWVTEHLSYEFGVSIGTTTAADTLLTASGVCRDYTHLSVCLLRGLNVPARYVAAYAPGLQPQDFHALVEAHDGEQWKLVDATGLSDPTHAVRIATGADGADSPFLTVLSGNAPVGEMSASARFLD